MIWTSVDSEAEGQQQQKSIILLNKKPKPSGLLVYNKTIIIWVRMQQCVMFPGKT